MATECPVELSTLGIKFLTETFEAFDKVSCILVTVVRVLTSLQDHDGALKEEELEELFSTSPGNPWVSQRFPETTVTNDSGAVTLQGWLAQWRFAICLPRVSYIKWALTQHDDASQLQDNSGVSGVPWLPRNSQNVCAADYEAKKSGAPERQNDEEHVFVLRVWCCWFGENIPASRFCRA